jgi:hypothetical protein
MKRARALLAVLVISGVALAACGGTSSLPEAEPCATPTPTPSPTSANGGRFVYRRAVSDAERNLTAFVDRFRSEYPGDTFHRRDSFRPDFAGWAGAAGCVLRDLRALMPPGANEALKNFDVTLEAILTDYEKVIERGEDAVRTRNTSEYKSFYQALTTVMGRLEEHVLAIP